MDSNYWCPLSSFSANTDIGWFRESSNLITQVQVIVVSSFPSQFFLSLLRSLHCRHRRTGQRAEQIIDCGTIGRNIRISHCGNRIGELASAPPGDCLEVPVPLDELQEGDMVGVIMHHAAAAWISLPVTTIRA